MLSVPSTSTSQADGIRLSLIMLMTVQGTMPRNSSIEVQHCTAETVSSLAFIQWSITAPSLAIFISAASGVSPTGMYFLMAASFACAASSLSFMRPMRPITSLRSSVSTVMPDFSSSFSE